MNTIFPLLVLWVLLFLSNSQHCVSDVEELEKSTLIWSGFVLSWFLDPTTKIYRSICLESFIENMFQSPLNELTNITFQEILEAYAANNCPVYLHGGLLRDILKGDPSHDIDLSFSCDSELAVSICKNLLGETEQSKNVSLCYGNKMGYIFIGRRKIDTGLEGKYWHESKFYQEEYTPNMLYYDLKNRVIIDMNTGVEDIRKQQIRIPVEPLLWDLWLFTPNKTISLPEVPFLEKWFVLRKVCRYWKLKVKGYTDSPGDDKSYLIGKINDLWDSPNYPMRHVFHEFLCEALGGRFYSSDFTCVVPGGFLTVSDDKIMFCKKYMHELYMDIQGLQDGRIFREINEMVSYTKCHDYHNNLYKGSANFIGKIEGMSLKMILIIFVWILSCLVERIY